MKNKRFKWWVALTSAVLLIIAFYVCWALIAAVPRIEPLRSSESLSQNVPSVTLPWPSNGQAAIGLNDLGVVATHGPQTASPMASTAKLITALCVLSKYPLTPGQSGPLITFTPADVAIYNQYQSEDGSDMVVVYGEKLSESQMLESMLLPSADNIADSLAIWAFGSLSNYRTYAEQYIKNIGLSSTSVGVDASGYDPSSTSTASDLVKLGEAAMSNSEIAAIVDLPEVSNIPLVGNIKNINFLLGKDNIVGIKTGNTDQAGGVFVSASKITINNKPLVIVTSEMQQTNLYDAVEGSIPLIQASQDNFSGSAISSSPGGVIVGTYIVPWSGQKIAAITKLPLDFKTWGGSTIKETIKLGSISDKSKVDQITGSLSVNSVLLKETGKYPLILNKTPGKPSHWWILIHPQSFIHL